MKNMPKKFIILSLSLTLVFVFSFSFVNATTISCTPSTANVGDTISCSGSDSWICKCNKRIDWGDGHATTGSYSGSHAYANSGTYVIRYTLCHKDGFACLGSCDINQCHAATTTVTISQSCTPDCTGVECGLDPVCGTKNCGTCTTSQICQGGICVDDNLKCIETDNGKDYYTAGCVEGSGQSRKVCDTCIDGTTLKEYYCNGPNRAETTFKCPGKCIYLSSGSYCEKACVDEDEDGYGKQGQNSGCDISGDDCDDTDESINPAATELCNNNKDDDCDGKIDCSDTDCVNQHPCTSKWTCTETDNGKDYNVKGTTKQFKPDGHRNCFKRIVLCGSVLG